LNIEMKNIRLILLWGIFVFLTSYGFSQQNDSTQKVTIFSGTLGVTNNGFSIIPTFSLNSPASIVQLSWRKNRFSIDPDIRLTPDARRGGVLLWFRYYPIERKIFKLRVGVHPAFNLQTREIIVNGISSEITQMRRFFAWELAPSFKINKHFSAGVFYLQGNGLQKDGPQTSHFINLNTRISNIKLGKKYRFALIPAVYYLKLDQYEGFYYTAVGVLNNTKWPFSLQSAFNKTIKSNLPGNKDFLWNVSINYHFSRALMVKK
jgi:hypothetical protein